MKSDYSKYYISDKQFKKFCLVTWIIIEFLAVLICHFYNLLFLINIKHSFLYPYSHIGGIYSYVVDIDTLFVTIVLTPIILFVELLSLIITWKGVICSKKSKYIHVIYKVIFIMLISAIIFSIAGYFEIWEIQLSLEFCDQNIIDPLMCHYGR
jgi:hypothetical protein